MKFRTLVVACAAVGLSAFALSPATAAVRPESSGQPMQATNPCSLDPQSGGGFEKVSGPGPAFEGAYAVVTGQPSGSCVKVTRGQQAGTHSHTVVVKSQGRVQKSHYDRASSLTRLDRKAGSKCTVTVWVKIAHANRDTGTYKATIELNSCTF